MGTKRHITRHGGYTQDAGHSRKVTPPEDVPRLYCLCIHYGLKEGKEWEWRGRHLRIRTEKVVARLTKDIRYLREVLVPRQAEGGRSWQGFAFIFLDPGWTGLIRWGEKGEYTAALLATDLASAQESIERRIKARISPPRRVRIITAATLLDLISLLAKPFSGKHNELFQLLAGERDTLRYDAPKVIEAAIRIGNIGRQVPIFRFDDDVIFYGQQARTPNPKAFAEETQTNILRLCEHYARLSRDPAVSYFVYSGGYAQPKDLREDGRSPLPKGDRVNDSGIINGFATRVVQLASLPRNAKVAPDAQARVSFRIAATYLRQLHRVGANPFRQVISGAGLCLSDSAILDLPPFSNMHLNVLWIDDHLKYALHDELGHFGVRQRIHYPARMANTSVNQLRHEIDSANPRQSPRVKLGYDDVRWHIQVYMLRLVLGCVADAWLRKDRHLKLGTGEFRDAQYERLRRKVPGVYALGFLNALPEGWRDPRQGQAFKQELWETACQRLRVLTTLWGDAKYKGTFLGLFVHGKSHRRYEEFKTYLREPFREGLRAAVEAMPPKYDETRDMNPKADTPTCLAAAVKRLVDDCVRYFDLWLRWPMFVRSVRFLLNRYSQTRRRELDWMFPEE